MNSISSILKALLRVLPIAAAAWLTSCDSMIYDYEGDCDPHYKVRFVYDRNLKYADAFASEVEEVTLYIIDGNGQIVWQKYEAGDELKSGSYLMDVDGITPGTYSLVAWCGGGHKTDFSIPESATHYTHLQSTLSGRSAHDEGWNFEGSAVRDNFRDLYHGKVMDVTFPEDEGDHIIVMPLTKDTNDVHVVLQHLSGDPVDESKFLFTIKEENGYLDWDNTILDDEPLTYYAHNVTNGYAGVNVPDYIGDGKGNESRAITAVSCAVADFQISRITPQKRCMVNIYRKEDKSLVASIPLADYSLITKGQHHKLSDADYLDYRDDYSLVLFLDDNGRWINTQIFINSWQLVLQDVDGI
ncbi:MAG: FimB/Mfa2 family fimbrial subunit [Clostridium sp.]|nr:FimB/Mfa2 family fimbrial subunit [Prevotella sp.]MCM1429027.1 FimB/Mfa2 family fimbrial subunit [Clostridium sp.]MCM1475442.1 FimB/Mfa2 family fimbrial subunit [Muribaculaceae bacterium]